MSKFPKLRGAFHHLHQLERQNAGFTKAKDYTIVPQPDLDNPGYTAFVVQANQPDERIQLLLGNCLQDLRSGLDHIAFALACAHTKPLPDDFAESSEFPIFGDENRKGVTGVGYDLFHSSSKAGAPNPGSGLYKTRGVHPDAQTIIESLQPYTWGKRFRSHPLWRLHELSRRDKHRLLHIVAWSFEGFSLDTDACRNVSAIAPGFLFSYRGVVEDRAKVASFKPLPINPDEEMHVEISLPLEIAFPLSNPVAGGERVLMVLADIYNFIIRNVTPALTPFL